MEKSIGEIKKWLGVGSINVFGLPFSGKDTVGKRLANDLSAKFLSSGEILREAEQSDSALANELRQGKLANTDKFKEIVLPHFSKEDLKSYPLVLSSVGRWSGEENLVMDALEKAGHELNAVILLDISHDDVYERWKKAKELADRGGRSDDDDDEVLMKRLAEFDEKTLPVLKHYKDLGLLLDIDGIGARDEVYLRVIEALKVLASRA